MPFLTPPPSVDVANLASKLPRPLQWPAGAIMGGLKSAVGGDDPSAGVMGAAMGGVGSVDAELSGLLEQSRQALPKVQSAIGEEVGHVGEAVHPAVQALVDMLHGYSGDEGDAERSLSRAALEHRVTGYDPGPSKYLKVPAGLQTKSSPISRPPGMSGIRDDIVRYMKQVGLRKPTGVGVAADPRFLGEQEPIQHTLNPAVRGLDALQDVQGPAEQNVSKPDIMRFTRPSHRPATPALGKAFADFSPEDIQAIQQEAGQMTLDQQQLAQKHGTSRGIINRILKSPWR